MLPPIFISAVITIAFLTNRSDFIMPSFRVAAASIVDDAPIQTLQFTPNVTHRNNLCGRQQLLRFGFIEFRDVLRGLNVSVGLGYIPGTGDNVLYDEEIGDFNVDYPGWYIDILDEIARRAGFSWRNSFGLVLPSYFKDSFRLQPNATYSDLLLWSVNAYDFSFLEWDHTIDRMKMGVDFPTGFSDTSTILVSHSAAEDKSSFQLFSFALPFELSVWASIAATIIVTGLVYRLVHKTYFVGQRTVQPCDSNNSRPVPGENIFYTALAATGHLNFTPVTHGERIMVFSLCLWSLIIVSTYTANLASFMIAKRQPIYPAVSLAEAERKNVPVCVAKDFGIETKIKKSYPNARLVEVNGTTLMYEYLRDGKCDLVADGFNRFETAKRNQTINPDCLLEWVGRAEEISTGGPASTIDTGFYCTSLVGHVLEYYMKEMQQDGFLESAFDKYLNSVSNYVCPKLDESSSNTEESSRLTMVDIGGIFIIHGICCVLALLISFFQRWWSNKRRKNQSSDFSAPEPCPGEGSGVIMSARQICSGNFNPYDI